MPRQYKDLTFGASGFLPYHARRAFHLREKHQTFSGAYRKSCVIFSLFNPNAVRQAANLIPLKISVNNMSIDLRLFKSSLFKGLISEAEYYCGEPSAAETWNAIDVLIRN